MKRDFGHLGIINIVSITFLASCKLFVWIIITVCVVTSRLNVKVKANYGG